MRKTIYSIGFLVIEYVFSVGLFTSCGDQFQEEYPWLIGKQEEMDNNNEEGAGATDITVLEKELKGAIPFMINYSHEPNGSWAPHKYQYYRILDDYQEYFCFRWSVAYALYFPQRLFGGPYG